MPRVVISDTSTLILFYNIERLDLLEKVYGALITTPEIASEYGEKVAQGFLEYPYMANLRP